MKYNVGLSIIFIYFTGLAFGQVTVLKADRAFDGEKIWTGGVALVIEGEWIKEIGKAGDISFPEGATIVELGDKTIMPGMIEGHAHLLLHPYNETSWNDQVLKESVAERAIRGAIHAEKSLCAGFTTVRDLGSEGAGFADVGLKQSIEKGIIPGPRLLVAGPAIVTTGSYGPKGFAEQVAVPLGAIPADGHDDLIREVRRQIGGGADFIKVYADYRWGPEGEAQPTFTLEELQLIVEVAQSSGRKVVAHAATPEGMRRATLAGVSTIEHGDGGTPEVFQLMRDKGVALCPTIAAGDAISQYIGWKKGVEPEPARIRNKRKSVGEALASGVTIVAGGDVGVFPHGDNVRELEMMVDYGMSATDVLRSVTATNADIFGLGDKLGRLKSGMLADIVVIDGDPSVDISTLRTVKMVFLGGKMIEK